MVCVLLIMLYGIYHDNAHVAVWNFLLVLIFILITSVQPEEDDYYFCEDI